jgi:hypothetical protein
MILSKVTPVTHSVGNCVKRVVVIVTSVLVFKTPVSAINAIGMSESPFSPGIGFLLIGQVSLVCNIGIAISPILGDLQRQISRRESCGCKMRMVASALSGELQTG